MRPCHLSFISTLLSISFHSPYCQDAILKDDAFEFDSLMLQFHSYAAVLEISLAWVQWHTEESQHLTLSGVTFGWALSGYFNCLRAKQFPVILCGLFTLSGSAEFQEVQMTVYITSTKWQSYISICHVPHEIRKWETYL